MFQLQLSKKSRQLLGALVMASLVSVFLYTVRAVSGDSWRYWFLNWNLLLAWPSLITAWVLKERVKKVSWLNWSSLILTALWLGFLPNSFYIVSDFIHLHDTGEVSLLFDVVLFISYTWNGYMLGFASLYIVHQALLKKVPRREAHILIGATLLLCGYAIYLGRYLRWNTWDVIVNPAGLLFDVSERVINPISHPQMFTTTAMFFVLLTSMYIFIWRVTGILGLAKRR